MNEIERLISFLPQSAVIDAPVSTPSPASTPPRDLITWMYDPAFGWNFVKEFYKAGLEIPFQSIPTSLVHASQYIRGGANPNLQIAHALAEDRDEFPATIVQALLLCPKVTFAQIAERVRCTPKAIEYYSDLWFNVRQRLDNAAYIALLVYPNGRFGDVDPRKPTLRQNLLQVAWERGQRRLLKAAGLLSVRGSSVNNSETAKELSRTILARGLEQLSYGDEDHPTVQLALRVLARFAAEDCMAEPVDAQQEGGGWMAVIADIDRIQAREQERRKIIKWQDENLKKQEAAKTQSSVQP